NESLKEKVATGVQTVSHSYILEDDDPIEMDWDSWLADSKKLREKVLARRNGEYIDTDTIWESVEADWEEHDNKILGA
ncbi:MAG: hypothetical protein AAF639_19425, partial [Chloroflexota bacterium]